MWRSAQGLMLPQTQCWLNGQRVGSHLQFMGQLRESGETFSNRYNAKAFRALCRAMLQNSASVVRKYVFIFWFQLTCAFIPLCFLLEFLLLSFAWGARWRLSPLFCAGTAYIKLLLARRMILGLSVMQSHVLVPWWAAWHLSALSHHFIRPTKLRVWSRSCLRWAGLSSGTTSTSPVYLTDAVEQLCLSLGCRQNESPALISLCLAITQTLKLPEMGRK